MKTLLAGAVVGAAAIVVLQVLLVPAYLRLVDDNLLILSLDRGALDENGVMMATYCGGGPDKEVLDKVPPDGSSGL